METTETQQAAEFFAKLANSHSRWPILTEAEKAGLVAEFKEFLAQRSHKLSKYWRERLSQMGSAEQPLMFVWLELEVAHTVWGSLPALFAGRGVRLPESFARVGWLKGRNIVVGLEPTGGEDEEFMESRAEPVRLAIKEFYRLLAHHPFPLAQCRKCQRVFVQMGHGKPRQYCSTSCRARGLPSAAKRTEYVRTYRIRKRKQEIVMTRKILRGSPQQERLERMQQAFPRKSRRQLLYLIKQAKRSAQPRKKKEE